MLNYSVWICTRDETPEGQKHEMTRIVNCKCPPLLLYRWAKPIVYISKQLELNILFKNMQRWFSVNMTLALVLSCPACSKYCKKNISTHTRTLSPLCGANTWNTLETYLSAFTCWQLVDTGYEAARGRNENFHYTDHYICCLHICGLQWYFDMSLSHIIFHSVGSIWLKRM